MLLHRKPSQWEESCLYPGSEEQPGEVSAILTIQLFLLATHPPKMRRIVGECLIVLFALLLGCWWPLAPAAAAEERGLVLDDPDVQPPYFVCLGGSWLAPTQTVCCYNYSATFDSTTIAITVNWPSDFTLTYDCGCSGEVPATSSTWQYACCRGPYYRQPCKICVTNNNLFITHYFGIIAETPCVDNAAE